MIEPDRTNTSRKFSSWIRGNIIHIVVLGLLLVYLSLIYPIHNKFLLHIGKPEAAWIDVVAETNMLHYIDGFQEQRIEGETVYKMAGWAFPENADVDVDKFQKHIVLIDASRKSYLFDARNVTRPDANTHFSYLNRDLRQSGFSLYISKYSLPIGVYNVGIVYSAEGSSTEYTRTDFFVQRTPNTLQLYRGHENPEPTATDRLTRNMKTLVKKSLLAIDPKGRLLARARDLLTSQGQP